MNLLIADRWCILRKITSNFWSANLLFLIPNLVREVDVFWFATSASNKILKLSSIKGSCDTWAVSRTRAKNISVTVYFENSIQSHIQVFINFEYQQHCLWLCKEKETQMKILTDALISSRDICICIEIQSKSVFLHKRGNLYCENPKHLRHFEKLECKVRVTFIRLFKELGVLNLQNCKRVKFLFAVRKWRKQHKVRHLVARKMHEQKTGLQFRDPVWSSKSFKWQRILELECSYILSSSFSVCWFRKK